VPTPDFKVVVAAGVHALALTRPDVPATRREMRIMMWLTSGLTYKEIGERGDYGQSFSAAIGQRLFARYGVAGRDELAWGVVRRGCKMCGVDPDIVFDRGVDALTSRNEAWRDTMRAMRDGRSYADIAREKGLRVQQVHKHMERLAIEEGVSRRGGLFRKVVTLGLRNCEAASM